MPKGERVRSGTMISVGHDAEGLIVFEMAKPGGDDGLRLRVLPGEALAIARALVEASEKAVGAARDPVNAPAPATVQ